MVVADAQCAICEDHGRFFETYHALYIMYVMLICGAYQCKKDIEPYIDKFNHKNTKKVILV